MSRTAKQALNLKLFRKGYIFSETFVPYYDFFVVNPPMAWQRSSYSEIQKKQVSYPWLKEKIH